jgi:4-carboxymuconolactone decarboxylase
MSRIREIERDDATPDQQRVGDAIFGSRNEDYGGPSAVMLHTPELAERFEDLRDALIKDERLPKPMLHFAALLVARFWSSQYTWWKRVEMCRAAGIPDDVIEAVRERRRPEFEDASLETAYDYVGGLLERGRVDDGVHARAVELLGEEGLIALVLLVGLYSTLAMVSDAFEPDLPAAVAPPLDEPSEGSGPGRLRPDRSSTDR